MLIQRLTNFIYSSKDLNPTLVDHAKRRYEFKSLPVELQITLEKVSNSKFINEPQKKALVIDPSYQITHLSKKSLIQLHEIISSYYAQKGNNSPFFIHLFDIEDHIFRQVLAEPKIAGNQYKKLLPKDSPLIEKINDLIKNGSRFYKLEPKNAAATHLVDFQIAKEEPKHAVDQQKPLKALKITAENRRNFSGGIAGVIIGLASAHKKLRDLNPACSKVYSFSPLYEKEKHIVRDFKFQGILTHFYDGRIVQSSIYKNKDTLEYLVQPDPSLPRIFNTPTTKAPYSEGVQDRFLYLGSAAAAFASFYKGKTGTRHIQVLQCENLSTVFGCAFSLLHSLYAPIREACGLKEKTRTIISWHHGNVGYQSTCNLKQMALLGIKSESKTSSNIDLIETGLAHAEKVVYVSKEIASRAIHPDPEINRGRRASLLEPGKLLSIPNGVELDKFDPTDKTSFKSLALKRTFDASRKETTDYSAYRKKLKTLLCEAKILKNPNLPLAVFVGRYTEEKGVKTLADVIETSPQELQFACMGLGNMDALESLKQMATTTHQGRLKVITTFEEQNINFCHNGENYGVPIGLLIRAAADFFIIPSHIEACGLVAMEGQCSGGLLIAPFHQGLKDLCKAEGYPSPNNTPYNLDKDANAICYQDPLNSTQAKNALLKALKIFTDKTEKERNQLAIRIRNEAISSYGWYHLDLPNQTLTGGAISYDSLYHDITKRPRQTTATLSTGSVPIQISLQPAIIEITPPSTSQKTPSMKRFINNITQDIFKRIYLSFQSLEN